MVDDRSGRRAEAGAVAVFLHTPEATAPGLPKDFELQMHRVDEELSRFLLAHKEDA
jgi:hypothetical protein